MITIKILYTAAYSGKDASNIEDTVSVPNNFFKWSEEKQYDYLNNGNTGSQIDCFPCDIRVDKSMYDEMYEEDEYGCYQRK